MKINNDNIFFYSSLYAQFSKINCFNFLETLIAFYSEDIVNFIIVLLDTVLLIF